jgi:methylmalonyl-CoA/ethylmalonyl-CoA epimerase/glyoxylase I family protein
LRFHHAGISVPDLPLAIDWYRDKLGFLVEEESELAGIRARKAFVARGAVRFELFELAGSLAPSAERSDPRLDLRTQGNKHVAIAVEALGPWLEELLARSVDVVGAARGGATAGLAGFYIRDCFGNLIEFVQA